MVKGGRVVAWALGQDSLVKATVKSITGRVVPSGLVSCRAQANKAFNKLQ